MRIFFCSMIFCFHPGFSQQKEVSITIDDVPNVEIYRRQGFSSVLLEQINTLNLPVAIFINEKNVYKNEFTRENHSGLVTWLKNKNVTAGNHSYSHMNYADTTLAAFQEDIVNGEVITRKTLKKSPAHFRFPFNSLGKDSAAHQQIKKFLLDKGYTVTPFTIESEDWSYNTKYEEALKDNNKEKALLIGKQYISHTLLLFEHFEKLCRELYGRNIRHIYLCHDNQLNTDYLVELTTRLQQQGYSFISLEDALQDKVYQSNDYYKGRFGFSWIYRWQPDEGKRKMLMRKEPMDEDLK